GPSASPHIQTKKRKHAGSRYTILRTLTTTDKGSWRTEARRVCNPCQQLNRSCMWRQDNKKVRTCYCCQRGKTSSTVDPANMEAGPPKKLRVMEKGKTKEMEPETEGAGRAAPSAMEQVLADILE